jgi:hypothetical protein
VGIGMSVATVVLLVAAVAVGKTLGDAIRARLDPR